tara:strand:- start:208 stop:414 length:207 start_codon:yes stop_codon:yes gene_type:complete
MRAGVGLAHKRVLDSSVKPLAKDKSRQSNASVMTWGVPGEIRLLQGRTENPEHDVNHAQGCLNQERVT